MRKLSLVFVFVMLFALVLAFNAFATNYNKIPTEDITVKQTDSTSDLLDLSKLVDGDYHTACTGGNSGQNWTNYHFHFQEGKDISKVVIVVNSTGANYNVSKNDDGTFNAAIYDTLTTNNYKLYFRLYDVNDKAIWQKNDFAISGAEQIKDADGNVLYTAFTFEFETTVADVYKVEVATMHNKNLANCLWEVEMYEHVCENGEHAFADDGNCTTAVSCNACGEVVREAKLHDFDKTTKVCKNAGCEFVFVGGCFEDYELGDLNKTESYYGEAEVKDENGKVIGGYNPGGNNSFSAAFDNKTGNTGWGGGPAPRYWSTNYNITLFYADLHLIRETTIWYVARAEGHGYAVELSNDGGVTWTEVGRYEAPGSDVGLEIKTVFQINNGAGMEANAYRLRWLNGYHTFQVTFTEIDIKGSERISCTWNEGVVTPATCGEDGKIVYTCTKCGDTKETPIAATGLHTWDEGVVTKDATEEEDGIKIFTCTVCGLTREETITAIQHNYVVEYEVVDATCEEIGYITYACDGSCGVEDCDKTYTDMVNVIPALGHNYESEVIIKATALNTGLIGYTCANCGDYYEETTAKLSWGETMTVIGPSNIINFEEYYANDKKHNNSDPNKLFNGVVDSTWTQQTGNGWFGPTGSWLRITFDKEYYVITTEFSCWANWNNATISYFDAEGNKTGSQSFTIQTTGSERQEATGLAGITKAKSMLIEVTYAKGDWGQCCAFQEFWITVHDHVTDGEKYDYVAPDCIYTGSYMEYCETCGLESYAEIPALGHKEGVAATCTESAICSVCEESYGEPNGHFAAVEATCTEQALCSVCNEYYGEPLGHNYEEFITLAPTCVAEGTAEYTCTVCGDSYEASLPIDETDNGHSYWPEWATVVYATCISEGYEKLICDYCQVEKEMIYPVDKENGHSYETDMETYVEPTCISDGYMEQTCLLCEDYKETVLEKNEMYHDYVADEESYVEATCIVDGYAYYVCTVCEDYYEETTPASAWLHDYKLTGNGLLQVCEACQDEYFYGTLTGKGDADGYSVMFNGNTINLYYTDDYEVLDVYYSYTIESVEDGVYTLALTTDGEDIWALAGCAATVTLTEENAYFTAVVSFVEDEETYETVYEFDNVVEKVVTVDGVYATEDGALKVVFYNGVMYIAENTTGNPLNATYAYEYNPMTGMFSSDFPAFLTFDVTTGNIQAGPMITLIPTGEEIFIPEIEINYGDKIGTIDAETTDTYTAIDLYSYTAAVAGQYSFFFPAGLGAADKAYVDEFAEPIFDPINYQSNTEGAFAVVNLEAGETIEFYITATEKATWEVEVWYYIEMAEADLVIGDNYIEANTMFTYIATANGTLTLTPDVVFGTCTLVYSVNGGDEVAFAEAVSIDVVAGDEVVVKAIVDGDGPFTALIAEFADVVVCEHEYTYACDKVCALCGETTNPDAAHTIEHVDAKAATCTANGNIEYWYCSDCGYAWEDAELTKVTNQKSVVVPATGHSYFYPCDVVCQVCFQETNTDAKHALVHVDAVAATCTADGNIEYWYCSDCGYAWEDAELTKVTNQKSVIVPAAGHAYAYDCDKNCAVCHETTREDAKHTLTHVDAVAATCIANGNIEYWYCSDCGYVWTDADCTQVTNQKSVVVPATGHTEVEIPAVLPTPSTVGYTAGTECSACSTVTKAPVEVNITELENSSSVNKVFRFAAINLSAQENISVNYKVHVTAGYNNPYVVFVFDGKEYIVDEYTIEASSGRYVFNFAETRPQLMASNIAAYLYGETADGEYTLVKYETYSVLQYILGQLKNAKAANNTALTTVMSDILVMGAKTQLYMGVNTNALVTDLAAAEGYTLTPTAFTTIDAVDQQATTKSTDGTAWKAVSLAFGASTECVFKFETDNLEGLYVKVSVAGQDTFYKASELTKDGNRYVVYFPGVRSYEYEETITATFERDGVQVGNTLTYSINTFLLRNYEKATYSAEARDLMKAIYIYGESIAKYFA